MAPTDRSKRKRSAGSVAKDSSGRIVAKDSASHAGVKRPSGRASKNAGGRAAKDSKAAAAKTIKLAKTQREAVRQARAEIHCEAENLHAETVRVIAVRTLRNDYRAVVDRVAAGEVVAIEDNGHAVAFMAPANPPRRRYVPLDQLVAQATQRPRPEDAFAERFMADIDDADMGTTDDLPDPWEGRARHR